MHIKERVVIAKGKMSLTTWKLPFEFYRITLRYLRCAMEMEDSPLAFEQNDEAVRYR